MNRRLVASAVAVAIVAVAVVVLGLVNPVRSPRVGTDRLGPDSQTVDEYVTFARSTLSGDDESPRWALLSLRSSVTTEQLASIVGTARVSQVFTHVALDRVQTPVIVVPVSASPVALRNAVIASASQVPSVGPGANQNDRAAAVATVTRSRLLENCACVAAVLVRATLADLRPLSDRPEVRAVEALPADAVYGKFGVTALLPETVDTAAVPADDGPVPAR